MASELHLRVWFLLFSAVGSAIKTGTPEGVFSTISSDFSMKEKPQILICYPQIFRTANWGPKLGDRYHQMNRYPQVGR